MNCRVKVCSHFSVLRTPAILEQAQNKKFATFSRFLYTNQEISGILVSQIRHRISSNIRFEVPRHIGCCKCCNTFLSKVADTKYLFISINIGIRIIQMLRSS